MEELLVLFGIVAGFLAIIAFRRSGAHAQQIEDLKRELASASERLTTLERAAAKTRGPAPSTSPTQEPAAPAVAPKPAAAVEPPPVAGEPHEVVEPPPVVAPPTVPSPVSTWAPTVRAASEQAPSFAGEPPAVEAPPVVVEPPQPSAFMRWLTGGNPLAKVGIVLLFFGIAYLVRYAAEHDLISIQLRLSGAAVIALGLLAIGWRLRHRSPVYALTLQGGADWRAVSHEFRRVQDLRAAAARAGVCAARRHLRRKCRACSVAARSRSCGAGQSRWLSGADSVVHRHRRSCGAVLLLRVAVCRHSRDQRVAGVAAAESRRLLLHVRRGRCLGSGSLRALALRGLPVLSGTQRDHLWRSQRADGVAPR